MGHEQTNSIPSARASIAIAIVALIVFAVVAVLYRNIAQENTLQELQKQIKSRLSEQARSLETELEKFSLLPLALSENPVVYMSFEREFPESLRKLNAKLASLAEDTGAPYIYVIDKAGNTIAASNFDQPDSFIGRNYEFRPYFQETIETGSSNYFAKGELTGKAGLFLAREVNDETQTIGVMVVKVEFEEIANLWRSSDATTFVTDRDGIVLFSSDPSLSYTLLKPLNNERREEIRETMQFEGEVLPPAPFKAQDFPQAVDLDGNRIQVASQVISSLGWQIHRAESIGGAIRAKDALIQSQVLSVGIVFLGMGLFAAWRVSLSRQRAETTAFLKTEVARQTKELSEANSRLELEAEHRERINDRFRTAREELAQANRLGSIGAITASVAHEVNQPVAAIKTFAENATKLLEREKYAQASDNLTSIASLASRIGEISNELRRYAKRGSQNIDKISVHKIIDGVELLIGDRIRAANIAFQIVGKDGDLPPVIAGRVRLEQVLVNLLQNAIEAVEKTENPRIEMRIARTGKQVSVAIYDNGPGVDAAIRSQIFTPFFSSKPKGLGIGLGIAKDIMTEFGGSIGLTDSPFGGAGFKLLLQTT